MWLNQLDLVTSNFFLCFFLCYFCVFMCVYLLKEILLHITFFRRKTKRIQINKAICSKKSKIPFKKINTHKHAKITHKKEIKKILVTKSSCFSHKLFFFVLFLRVYVCFYFLKGILLHCAKLHLLWKSNIIGHNTKNMFFWFFSKPWQRNEINWNHERKTMNRTYFPDNLKTIKNVCKLNKNITKYYKQSNRKKNIEIVKILIDFEVFSVFMVIEKHEQNKILLKYVEIMLLYFLPPRGGLRWLRG